MIIRGFLSEFMLKNTIQFAKLVDHAWVLSSSCQITSKVTPYTKEMIPLHIFLLHVGVMDNWMNISGALIIDEELNGHAP
jgi:hypothetical protein